MDFAIRNQRIHIWQFDVVKAGRPNPGSRRMVRLYPADLMAS